MGLRWRSCDSCRVGTAHHGPSGGQCPPYINDPYDSAPQAGDAVLPSSALAVAASGWRYASTSDRKCFSTDLNGLDTTCPSPQMLVMSSVYASWLMTSRSA